MNDIDRQILSFMRDVREPAQRNFSVGIIDDNVEADVRKRHLDLLEGRGLVNKSVPDEDSEIIATTYWLSAEGMQAIITEDLNNTLGTTNQRLSETQSELEELQDSNTRSSAVQTVFSAAIIYFSMIQVLIAIYSNDMPILASAIPFIIGIVMIGYVGLIGKESFIEALR